MAGIYFHSVAASAPPVTIPIMDFYLAEHWVAGEIPSGGFGTDISKGQTAVNIGADEVAYIWTEESGSVYIRGITSDGIDTRSAAGGSTVKVATIAAGFDPGGGPGNDVDACVLNNGNIVITWSDVNYDTGFIIVQPGTDANGRTFTVVKSYTSVFIGGYQPTVSLLNNGNFVMAWDNFDTEPYTGKFRIFDQAGDVVSSITDFYSNADAYEPTIAVLNSGKFVITFLADNEAETSYVIYNENGTSDTGLTVLSKGNGTALDYPRGTIALSDGGWVSTYLDEELYIKKFNSSGSLINTVQLVSDTTVIYSTAILTDDGYIMVLYNFDDTVGPYSNMKLQLLDTDLNIKQSETDLVSNSSIPGDAHKLEVASFNSKGEAAPSAGGRVYSERFCVATGKERYIHDPYAIFDCIQNTVNTTWESIFNNTKWQPGAGSWTGSAWTGTSSLDLDKIPGAWPWADATGDYRPIKIRFTFSGVSSITSFTMDDDNVFKIINESSVTSGQEVTIAYKRTDDGNADISSFDLSFTGTITVTNIEFEVAVE